jgi:hypothetical protein
MNEFSSPNLLRHCIYLLRRATTMLSVAQALLRWKTCISACAREERNATKAGFAFELAHSGHFLCVHCGMPIRGMRRSKHRVLIFNATLAKTVRGDEQWTYL